jgi:hypothetical protein
LSRSTVAKAAKASTSMRQALAVPGLLGGVLRGPSWLSWRSLLIAANGEALTGDEREVFRRLTGREREPLSRVDEFVAVAGRRGGKSRAAAVLAIYHAIFVDHSGVLCCWRAAADAVPRTKSTAGRRGL